MIIKIKMMLRYCTGKLSNCHIERSRDVFADLSTAFKVTKPRIFNP